MRFIAVSILSGSGLSLAYDIIIKGHGGELKRRNERRRGFRIQSNFSLNNLIDEPKGVQIFIVVDVGADLIHTCAITEKLVNYQWRYHDGVDIAKEG